MRQESERRWRGGFYYRQAGFSFVEGRYFRGLAYLLRSAAAGRAFRSGASGCSSFHCWARPRARSTGYLAHGVGMNDRIRFGASSRGAVCTLSTAPAFEMPC